MPLPPGMKRIPAVLGKAGGLSDAPTGFFYLVDTDGAFIVDTDGAFLLTQ